MSTNKKKITNFLCVCGALPRSSVWQCQLCLFPSEKSPQGHFDFRWMNTILKNTWERIIELENQVLYWKKKCSQVLRKIVKKKKNMKWRIRHKTIFIFWSKWFFITLNFWLKDSNSSVLKNRTLIPKSM